jgi:hypothetical protein
MNPAEKISYLFLIKEAEPALEECFNQNGDHGNCPVYVCQFNKAIIT